MSTPCPDKTARPVIYFPDYYVTPDGRVWSTKRGGRWLQIWQTKFGHIHTELYDHGRHNVWVHALVLEAFVGPRPEGKVACHNDGNPSNNHVENLRWDTPKGNWRDSVRHGTNRIGRKTKGKVA